MEKKNKKTQDIKKNYFFVRVSNDDTLTSIEELLKTNIFSSRNVLLNKCLDEGVNSIYTQFFGKEKPQLPKSEYAPLENTNRDLPRSLKQLENTTDDMFVILNILEQMLTTLYNVKAAELSGMPVGEDDMRSGRLSDLPTNLEAVKEEIIKRYTRRN